jgi:DNA-binding transcriptional regulator YhcF (GntR family)
LHIGSTRAGDRLPGVREIAAEFGVDARTALRAARKLEDEGLIELRNRSGMYIAARPALVQTLSPAQQTVCDVIYAALARGIDPAELRRTLDDNFYRRKVRVGCVEANVDHAQAIAAMASRRYGVETVPITLAAVEAGELTAFATIDAVITTAFLASSLRRVAGGFGCPVFTATVESEQGEAFMRSLADRPVYVIGVDRRWAERAAAALDQLEIGLNLHVFVLGVDDIEQIPDEAEIFATPVAAARTAELPIASRIRVLRYALPPSEAREFIATIVAAHAKH